MAHTSNSFLAFGLLFLSVLQGGMPGVSSAQSAPPYYFDEHVDEGILVSPPVAVSQQGGAVSLFPVDQPLAWTAVKPTSQCRVIDNALVLSCTDGDSFLSPEGLNLYGPAMSHLELKMVVSGADEVKISWRQKDMDWGWAKEEGACVFRLPIPERNKPADYSVRLDELSAWKSTNIDQIQLSVEGSAEIHVQSIRVVTRTGLFSDRTFGKCRYALGGAARECLFTRCPATVEYRVHVPATARFSTLLGIADPSGPARFTVSVKDGAEDNTLLTREITSSKRWECVSVDMGSYADRNVTIVLKADAAQPGQAALWGNAGVYEARQPVSGKAPGGEGEHPNILIYLVDALRADHLPLYGYGRETCPNLTAFAATGVRFEHGFSQATCTTPSISSLMTGVDSLRHGLMCFTGSYIPRRLVTLPEILRAAGYVTGAVSENSFTPPPDGGRGAYRSIDELDESTACVDGSTYGAIGDFLESNRDRPFLLYVHTMECHGRRAPDQMKLGYAPPEPWRSIWASPAQASPADCYDGSIVLADHNFGRVLKRLEKLGLASNTVVIFSADHGERLNDRNDESGHGYDPFQDQVHVPLVVRRPGVFPEGAVVSENVQLLDVAPSVLDMCNLPPCGQFQGLSLRPLLGGGDHAAFRGRDIFCFSGWNTMGAAVIRDDWKFLLCDFWMSAPCLFNLRSDPGETNNEILTQPAIAEELRGALLDHSAKQLELRAHDAAESSDTGQSPINSVDAEQLRALGYVGR